MIKENELKNKKILLIISPFYEYHIRIQETLSNFGCSVTVLYNQLNTVYAYSQNKIIFLLKYIFRMIDKQDISKQLEEKYDFVLALGGYTYNEKILKKLKKNNPNIKTIVYYWDSFYNWKSSYTIDWFDYRYSFDRFDCLRYNNKNLNYLPLFYINNPLTNRQEETKYDLLYIGSFSPFSLNRIFWLKKICKEIQKNNIKAFVYLYCPRIKVSLKEILYCMTSISYFLYAFFAFLFRNEPFVFHDKLSLTVVKDIVRESKCLLDIPVVNQSGISIGVIEAMANGNKIITTNENIKHDKFYREENIYILNKKNMKGINDFMKINYLPMDISYLKIENWLKTLLG